MEFLKKATKVGNSAGVLLPKKLLGSEVKITVINRPINIRKEVIKLLEQYFIDLIGIYILNKKPIEILAISTNLRKIITDGKLKISIIPISIIKRDIKTKPKLKAKLIRAEPILNKSLLFELKKQIRSYS